MDAKLVMKKHRVFKKYKDKEHLGCKRASRLASCEVKKAKYISRENGQKISKEIKSRSMLMSKEGPRQAGVLDPW